MRALLLVLIFASGITAQTSVVPLTSLCPIPQITVVNKLGNIGTGFVVVSFSCIALDPSVTMNTTTTPPTVVATPPLPPGTPTTLTVVAFSPSMSNSPVMFSFLPKCDVATISVWATINDPNGTVVWNGVASGTGKSDSSLATPVFCNGQAWVYR